jgi:predicted DNA-binding transcriptional regulator YafY
MAAPPPPDREGRVERLEALKLLLAERDYATSRELADDLGVGLRTLRRDIATLRELGIPVGGVIGRGGGIHLERGWSLGRVHLNEQEAVGLLLSLAIAHQINSPLLLSEIRSIERKVAQAFAPSQASRIRGLRQRVLIGATASEAVLDNYRPPSGSVLHPLLQAFTTRHSLEIDYIDQSGLGSTRTIEPHYLYYNLPVWYVVGWDQLRVATRTFRIDRITRVVPTERPFKLRPLEDFTATAGFESRTL